MDTETLENRLLGLVGAEFKKAQDQQQTLKRDTNHLMNTLSFLVDEYFQRLSSQMDAPPRSLYRQIFGPLRDSNVLQSTVTTPLNPNVQDPAQIIRWTLKNLTRREVGVGFATTINAADNHVFLHWLHQAVYWQAQDVLLKHKIHKSIIRTEELCNEKKEYIKQSISLKLLCLWYQEARQITLLSARQMSDRLDSLVLCGDSNIPLTQAEEENRVMAYEDVLSSLDTKSKKKNKPIAVTAPSVQTLQDVRDLRDCLIGLSAALDQDEMALENSQLQAALLKIQEETDSMTKLAKKLAANTKRHEHELRQRLSKLNKRRSANLKELIRLQNDGYVLESAQSRLEALNDDLLALEVEINGLKDIRQADPARLRSTSSGLSRKASFESRLGERRQSMTTGLRKKYTKMLQLSHLGVHNPLKGYGKVSLKNAQVIPKLDSSLPISDDHQPLMLLNSPKSSASSEQRAIPREVAVAPESSVPPYEPSPITDHQLINPSSSSEVDDAAQSSSVIPTSEISGPSPNAVADAQPSSALSAELAFLVESGESSSEPHGDAADADSELQIQAAECSSPESRSVDIEAISHLSEDSSERPKKAKGFKKRVKPILKRMRKMRVSGSRKHKKDDAARPL